MMAYQLNYLGQGWVNLLMALTPEHWAMAYQKVLVVPRMEV
jgi:hypothetical protein